MLILKGLAVYKEAAVVVEVGCVGVPVWGRLGSGWAGVTVLRMTSGVSGCGLGGFSWNGRVGLLWGGDDLWAVCV